MSSYSDPFNIKHYFLCESINYSTIFTYKQHSCRETELQISISANCFTRRVKINKEGSNQHVIVIVFVTVLFTYQNLAISNFKRSYFLAHTHTSSLQGWKTFINIAQRKDCCCSTCSNLSLCCNDNRVLGFTMIVPLPSRNDTKE